MDIKNKANLTVTMTDNDGGSTKGHDPSIGYGDNGPSSKKKQSRTGARRKGRRRPLGDQRFSSYLSFGVLGGLCLTMFFLCYVIILACTFPLLVQESPKETPTHRGEVLRPMVERMKEKASRFGNGAGGMAGAAVSVAVGGAAVQHIAENAAVSIQHKIQQFRKSEGVTDASLMRQAVSDIDNVRKQRRQPQPTQNKNVEAEAEADRGNTDGQKKKVSGFVVLGMHRSGTSMLSGLLAIGMGYKTGGPLIGSAFDNKKGFFELLPAVLQNDEFMGKQHIWWSAGVVGYDYKKALQDKESGVVTFKEGAKALSVLNSPEKIPWLQKDPRMCITLRTWLPLLNSEPAILFTYRHPLEVAQSLHRRENGFTLDLGLRLWIVYNMRAVQNSANLCRVITSNEAILANPLAEVNRTSFELTNKCHVPPPPNPISQEDVDKFVDSGLQHTGAQKAAEKANRKVLESHNDGSCPVYDYDSSYKEAEEHADFARERDLYLKAMKIYCDFESGAAFKPDYAWPELQ